MFLSQKIETLRGALKKLGTGDVRLGRATMVAIDAHLISCLLDARALEGRLVPDTARLDPENLPDGVAKFVPARTTRSAS